MSIKILVCRVGKEPHVEEVESPFDFVKLSLLDGGYVELKNIDVGDERVTVMWDEDAKMKKLPFNRNVPARCPFLPEDVSFVVDTREGPPEVYATPGDMGYFEILGNFIVSKMSNNGAQLSLSDKAIRTLTALLTLPKCKQCKSRPLAYRGAVFCGAACCAAAEMKLPPEKTP